MRRRSRSASAASRASAGGVCGCEEARQSSSASRTRGDETEQRLPARNCTSCADASTARRRTQRRCERASAIARIQPRRRDPALANLLLVAVGAEFLLERRLHVDLAQHAEPLLGEFRTYPGDCFLDRERRRGGSWCSGCQLWTCLLQFLVSHHRCLRALLLGLGRLGDVGVQVGDDRLLAGHNHAAGDEDGDRFVPGRADQLVAVCPLDRHLASGVGEAEFGEALANAV